MLRLKEDPMQSEPVVIQNRSLQREKFLFLMDSLLRNGRGFQNLEKLVFIQFELLRFRIILRTTSEKKMWRTLKQQRRVSRPIILALRTVTQWKVGEVSLQSGRKHTTVRVWFEQQQECLTKVDGTFSSGWKEEEQSKITTTTTEA